MWMGSLIKADDQMCPGGSANVYVGAGFWATLADQPNPAASVGLSPPGPSPVAFFDRPLAGEISSMCTTGVTTARS
jgi:hypothetical protein